MKIKIGAVVLLLSCFTVQAEEIYVKPNVLAKQFLTELAFKETLINAFSHKLNCKINLGTTRITGSHSDRGVGTLTKITDHTKRRKCLAGCIKTCCDSQRITPCPESCTTSETQSIACQMQCTVNNPVSEDQDVVTIGAFKSSNIEVVKMEIVGDPRKTANQLDDEDRTFKAYYKRTGLEVYNTIDNQTCSNTETEGCFKAECTLEYQIDDPTTMPYVDNDESKCKLLSCCESCWSITGGL